MTSSESLRGVRPNGGGAAASDGARRPRADRIEIDFSWSEPRSRDTRRASRREDGTGHLDERPSHEDHRARREERGHSPVRASAEPAHSTGPFPYPAPPNAVEPGAAVVSEPTVEDVLAHSVTIAPRLPATVPSGAVNPVAPEDPVEAGDAHPTPPAPERRTVVIRGQGARGYAPARGGYQARLRPHERAGFRPDRVALWAVLLGLALLLGAVTSSHAATLHHVVISHHAVAGHLTTLHQLADRRPLIHPAP